MRRDWKMWTIYINRHKLDNWAIGLDYYHEWNFIPTVLLARIFQVNLLFFNITFTRWENRGWDL